MMREILFRGKRTDCGEWIYGYINQHRGEPILDCMCEQINSDDFYIDDYAAKIDTGIYGLLYKIIPETVGQYTGLTDKNGVRIFEGDRIIYRHQCKKLIPCDDATQEEKLRYGIDNDSGLGLAYRPTRTIRYKGYVTIDNLWGLDLNLGNRCQWWRCKEGEQLMAVEIIGNIHDNPELLDREECENK